MASVEAQGFPEQLEHDGQTGALGAGERATEERGCQAAKGVLRGKQCNCRNLESAFVPPDKPVAVVHLLACFRGEQSHRAARCLVRKTVRGADMFYSAGLV